MSMIWWVFGAVVLVSVLLAAGLAGLVLWQRLRAAAIEKRMQAARASFRQQREWIEARFFTLASQSGRPRGLAWVDCEFADAVSFARDKTTGELRALVALNISFEAIEGGDMEDNPNVGRIRAATAVFLHRNNRWETDGRAIMNLGPEKAIEHFQDELETVD